MIKLSDFSHSEGYQKLQAAIDASAETGIAVDFQDTIETPIQINHKGGAKIVASGAVVKAVNPGNVNSALWRFASNQDGQEISGDILFDGNGLLQTFLVQGLGNQDINITAKMTFENFIGALRVGSHPNRQLKDCHYGHCLTQNPLSSESFTIHIQRAEGRDYSENISFDIIEMYGLYGQGIRGDQLAVHGTYDFYVEQLISKGGHENGATFNRDCVRPVIDFGWFAENDKHGLCVGGSYGRMVFSNPQGIEVGDIVTASEADGGASCQVAEVLPDFCLVENLHRRFPVGGQVSVGGVARSLISYGTVTDGMFSNILAHNNGLDADGNLDEVAAEIGFKPLGGLYNQHASANVFQNVISTNNPFGVYNASSTYHLTGSQEYSNNDFGEIKDVGRSLSFLRAA